MDSFGIRVNFNFFKSIFESSLIGLNPSELDSGSASIFLSFVLFLKYRIKKPFKLVQSTKHFINLSSFSFIFVSLFLLNKYSQVFEI